MTLFEVRDTNPFPGTSHAAYHSNPHRTQIQNHQNEFKVRFYLQGWTRTSLEGM